MSAFGGKADMHRGLTASVVHDGLEIPRRSDPSRIFGLLPRGGPGAAQIQFKTFQVCPYYPDEHDEGRARTPRSLERAHGSPASIRLDVGVLDHLAPLDELGLHVVSQLLRRAGKTLKAHVLEPRLNVRAVDDLA